MRLFVALLFPETVKDALRDAALDLKDHASYGVFSRRENFHLTLSFLGEVRDPRPVKRAMAAAAAEAGPFELKLDRPGRFRRQGGDIWWVGLKAAPELTALHRRLNDALRAEGFPGEDRAFRPHVTLGRQVTLTDPAFRLQAPGLTIPARELCLMRSQRLQGVLTYTCLHREPLRE